MQFVKTCVPPVLGQKALQHRAIGSEARVFTLGLAIAMAMAMVVVTTGCSRANLEALRRPPSTPAPAQPPVTAAASQTQSNFPSLPPTAPQGSTAAGAVSPTVPSSTPIARVQPTVRAANFTAYKLAAAQKILQANPDATFAGALPDPLASIPVLEVALLADGSVQSIDVLRKPHFFLETIELAKAAILKAAPFGPVAHLPKPWQFSETFLFNDDLKFQLHALQP